MKRHYGILLALLVCAAAVAAHEVYVLNSTTITTDFAVRGINVFDALKEPSAMRNFVAGTILVALGFILLSYLIHTKLSKKLDERFATMRKYAHLVIRVGLGVSFLWGAFHDSIFGPEIPLHTIPGGLLWKPILIVVGVMLIIGLFTRLAAFLALLSYLTVTAELGSYMMNYLNYFGEIAVLLIERGELYSVDEHMKWPSHIFHNKLPEWIDRIEKWGEEYSFPIIRITYGVALIWAAMSVKILHPALSLDVLHYNNLDTATAITALFVVLAAGFIEILLGLVLVTGIMYRICLLILVLFVGYSVWFFGEEVWPHAILVALSIGLFLHGKDKLSLEDWFYRLFWRWTARFRKNKSALSPE